MHLLHLAGSPVSDFFAELSRTYARDALAVLGEDPRWEHTVAWVGPDGRWRFPDDLDEPPPAEPSWAAGAAVAHVAALGVDLVVPQMFCPPGMTSYRALFDVLGVRVVGNPPAAMALGAHKARARAVVAAAGVDVPRGEVLAPGEAPTIPPPVVVKPVDADNSVGVALVTDAADLPDALAAAFSHAGEVLVEQYVPLGREVRCAVVERDGELVGLPLEEYAVATVRSYDDKLAPGAAGIELVAKGADRAWIVDPSDPVTAVAWDVARRCHRALGCRDYSLVDLRVDPDGRPWFLEASLYCSFARGSVVATMAEAAGIPVTELFASMALRAT